LSRNSFIKAIASLPYIKQIKIPYENTALPGYFIKASAKDAPLLIVHTGFDGTAEELYFQVGLAAHKRGYNCIIFEGPGQGEMIRIQNLPFRYDWEKVVTPVIDYALTLPDVNKHQIALMGISMGGYLAPRAAAFDYRIEACIANGGIFDFSENIYNNWPPEEIKLLRTDPEEFNRIAYEQMNEDIGANWFFEDGMWTFHADSPAELMLLIKKYTLKDVVKRIKCHMLVLDSEEDMFEKGQPRKLYNELQSPKEYILFTTEEAAQAHCQIGAVVISDEIIFDWLDKLFDRR
jgi:esterase/lipase